MRKLPLLAIEAISSTYPAPFSSFALFSPFITWLQRASQPTGPNNQKSKPHFLPPHSRWEKHPFRLLSGISLTERVDSE
jgi:hypothetical protein